MSTSDVKQSVRQARNSTPVRAAARSGFAVNGLIHAIIGFLAIGVAFGSAQNADQNGAFQEIAETPGGTFVLWAVTVGLGALGLWLLVGAFLLPRPDTKRRIARVLVDVGKGLTYLVFAVLAGAYALGRGTAGDPSWSAKLLEHPAGVALLVVIGLAIFAVGVYFVVKGVRQRFRQDINLPSGQAGRGVVAVGVVGYVAKGLALGTVGVLFVIGAVTADPSQATGLDHALKQLTSLPGGTAILVGIGVGFIAYGVYSVIRARLARL